MSAKTNESTKSFWQVKLRYFSWACMSNQRRNSHRSD